MKRYLWICLLIFFIAGIGGRDRYNFVNVNDYLLAHYKMDDNTASATVVDSTGSHNGTFKDAAGDPNTDAHDVTGKISGSLDFDGTDDYIEIADHNDLSPNGAPFSISIWINPDNTSYFPILRKGVIGTDCEYCLAIADFREAIHFALYDKDDQLRWIGRGNGNTSLSASQWYHIVVTYDGGILSSGIEVYVNGSRDGGSEDNSEHDFAASDGSHAVWMGRGDTSTPTSHFADGKIDNVMFFNKELTAREVRKLYRPGYRGRHRY